MKIRPDEPCPCGSGETYAACHGRARSVERGAITDSVPLEVIEEPDPGTRTVFQGHGESSVIFRGTESAVAYTCGSCDAPLVVGVDITRIQEIVLGCSQCKSFNESRPRTGRNR